MALYHTSKGSVNYTVMGSPTIVNGVASGFTFDNYLTVQQPTSGTAEFVFKFTYISNGTNQTMYRVITQNNENLICIKSDNKLRVSYTANSSQVQNLFGTTTFSNNTTYWLKYIYVPSNSLEVYLSTDGTNYTFEVGVQDNMSSFANTYMTIGGFRQDSYTYKNFAGSIDLNETYISVNGQPWFGVSPVEVKRVVRQQGDYPAEVSGVDSLSLPNAKANSLTEVKLSGGTEQRNLPSGYTQVEYLQVATANVYLPTGINATIDTDMGITASNITSSSAQILVAECTSGSDYFRIAKAGASQRIIGSFGSSTVTDNNTDGINKFTVRMNKSGFYVNGSLIGTFSNIPSSLTDIGNIDIFRGKYSETVYYAYSGSRFHSAWVNDNIFLPCRRNSDNQLGIYNTKTGVFILPSGTGTFTAGPEVTAPSPDTPIDIVCNNGALKVNSQGQIYTDGTQEVVTDSLGNTANAERLLAIGSYKDMQEVINGSVTKRVGIAILDGTETWNKSSTYIGSFYTNNMNPSDGAKVADNSNVYCTHGFKVNSLIEYSSAQVGATYWYSPPTINYKYDDGTATVAQFKQFLAEQYANGTPVIIVYPLATATTESVTAQTLNVQAGNNTLSVTQASMSGLGLSAKYTQAAKDVKYVVKDDKLVFADQRLYLTGPVNYTKIGSPTIVDGVLTSASSNDYVQTTSYTLQGTETIEFGLKIKPKLGITGYHSGVGGIIVPNDYNMVTVGAYDEGHGYVFRLLCAYNSDWGADFIFSETTTLGPNDWFWTRIVLDCANNTIAAYYSYDGNTWTLKDTKTISNGYAFVGKNIGYQGQLFDGSTKILEAIDLNNTYVKINGSLWFYGKNYASKNIAPVPANYTYGTTTTSAIGYVDMRTQAFTAAPTGATLKLDDYGEPWQCTRVGGSVYFFDYGIVTGFYSNDYFYTNNTLDTSKDFEICLACTPQYQSWTILGVNSQGTETSGFVMSLEGEQQYCLFTTDNDGEEGPIIRGSHVAWGVPTLIKFSQVGKTVKLETSTDDGATWTLQGSGHMRTYCRKTTGVSFGGGWYGGYLNGYIDLNKTYIKTDGVKHRLVLNI